MSSLSRAMTYMIVLKLTVDDFTLLVQHRMLLHEDPEASECGVREYSYQLLNCILSVRIGGSCMKPICSHVLYLSYLNIIRAENVNRCCWKVVPVNCPHCQNQRIRRDDLTVTSDNQLKTQLIYCPNQPVSRTQDKTF